MADDVLNDNTELGINPELPETPEPAEPTRRRRGRKPKNETAPAPEAAPGAESPENKPTRRRSRKVNANSVQQIIGIHKMISMLPGMEIFAIEENEAQILAEGMQGIADEYGVTMSGKTGATLNMVAALAMVYGPRGYLLYQQRQAAKAPPALPEPVSKFQADGKPGAEFATPTQ